MVNLLSTFSRHKDTLKKTEIVETGFYRKDWDKWDL